MYKNLRFKINFKQIELEFIKIYKIIILSFMISSKLYYYAIFLKINDLKFTEKLQSLLYPFLNAVGLILIHILIFLKYIYCFIFMDKPCLIILIN